MAQFVEVMKQARRLCEEQQNIDFCVRCPMQGKDGCMVVADAENIDYVEVERKIMDWAAEHHEPVYPTWSEWQNSMFPDADGDMSPCEFGSRDRFNCAEKTCAECMEQQIPADIAEKLGIKPISYDDDTLEVEHGQ